MKVAITGHIDCQLWPCAYGVTAQPQGRGHPACTKLHPTNFAYRTLEPSLQPSTENLMFSIVRTGISSSQRLKKVIEQIRDGDKFQTQADLPLKG